MRPFLVLVLAAATAACASAAAVPEAAPTETAAPAPARSGRLRPPAALACDRNQLTSWSGRVSGYKHGADSTWIEIHTDENTVESTEIAQSGKADAFDHYLLWGEPFSADDLASIEQADGKLVPGTRAVAWVCLDGKTAPVIDWQPPKP